MIDWSATGDMLSGIGTISGSVAIVVAAVMGRRAVADFRQQKQIEREIEHAEKALAVAYQLEMAISSIRSPLSTAGEIADSQSELEKTDWFQMKPETTRTRLIQSNVFYQRIRRFTSEFDEAISALPFVKAYFGAEAGDALANLIGCRHSVRVYADAYGENPGTDLEFQETIRSYIWEGLSTGEGDPLKQVVMKSIATLEHILLPVVRSERGATKVVVSV